jgi:hypothetical protein
VIITEHKALRYIVFFTCYLLALKPKYVPQHPVIEDLCYSLNVRDRVSRPYKTTDMLLDVS